MGVMMRNRRVLVVLSFVGSGLCWGPLVIEPNLGLPWWTPLACVALGASLATLLCPEDWRWFSIASAIGAFSGLCVSFVIWWPTGPIAGSWVPVGIAVLTVLAVLAALVACLTGRRVRLLTTAYRRAAWLALAGCIGIGPVLLALTPPLVARRIALNDQAAAARFKSLRNAARQTALDPKDQGRLCDGEVLKRHYSGPGFSNDDWQRITGNYVKQDGYVFMVYCREQGGYTIDAMPARIHGDGNRHFCADESGRTGCGLDFNESRHVCTPCAQ
jgi:hypothetical protein